MKLSTANMERLARLIQDALGKGESQTLMGQDEVFVSIIVDKTVYGEIRVAFQDFDDGHWEIHQRLVLWNHSISAHNADYVADLLKTVGARVRDAEDRALVFMRALPGARVSSEFAPIKIDI